MCAVLVNFNAGFWLCLGVGVATNVVSAFDDEDALAKLRGQALGHGQTEKARTDDEQVVRIVFQVRDVLDVNTVFATHVRHPIRFSSTPRGATR